jgi:hypothetical protein
VPLKGPDTSPGVPGEVRLCCFRRNNGHWQDDSTVGCGLEWPTWLFGCSRLSDQLSASSGAHRDVLLPSGGLDLGESSAGYFHIPPSFTLVFSRERYRGIHPSICPFNRSPGHYPGIRRTHLSVAELPAAVRSLFTRGGFALASAGRGADPVPDSGPGAGRLAASSIELPELDESSSVALRLPAVALGFCWEIGFCSRAEPGCWSDPCALADASPAAFFFWATIFSFSCLSMFGYSSRWALRKVSSSFDASERCEA